MKGKEKKDKKDKKVLATSGGLRPSKVWVNPNSTFKGPRSIRIGDHGVLSPPTAARLLELADVALASGPPARRRKLTA